MSATAGLQCGFGAPLGTVLAELKGLAFSLIRLDLQDVDDATTTALAQEVLDAGLQPLCIIRRPEQMLAVPPACLMELGNEPDLEHFGWTPESYGAAATDAVELALTYGLTLYVGAVSNLNRRGFEFLRTLPWADYPPQIRCSIHRYPETGSATKPHDGCHSRDGEVTRLRDIVGHRPLACSEVGYSEAEWTAVEVACNMAYERQFWTDHHFDFCSAYQLNDGPEPDSPEQYGFRRLDGTWKPVAYTFTSPPRAPRQA